MAKITYIIIGIAIVAFVALGGIGKIKPAAAELKKETKNLKSYTQKKIESTKAELKKIQDSQKEDEPKV